MGEYIPRVSIGLPVFNGENFIEAALDSLLTQTYQDFELIISDNASTDRTKEICESYSAIDSRIHYYRNNENIGAGPNFNRLVELSRGEYFKWASHDDVCAPTFVEKCVEVLEQDREVILAYPMTVIIDEFGEPCMRYVVELDGMSSKPYERFSNMISKEHWCFQIFGVARTEELKRTQLIGPYSDSDRIFLSELSLRGKIYEVPDHLFLRRDHPGVSTRAFPDDTKRREWFDPKVRGYHSPMRLKFRNYAHSIERVPLNRRERLLSYLNLGFWAVDKILLRSARRLGFRKDLAHIVIPLDGTAAVQDITER